MTTRLEGALRREIEIDGALYTLTIDPEGLKLVPKGRRKGHALAWRSFIDGEAALAAALNASIAAAPEPAVPAAGKKKPARNRQVAAGRGQRKR